MPSNRFKKALLMGCSTASALLLWSCLSSQSPEEKEDLLSVNVPADLSSYQLTWHKPAAKTAAPIAIDEARVITYAWISSSELDGEPQQAAPRPTGADSTWENMVKWYQDNPQNQILTEGVLQIIGNYVTGQVLIKQGTSTELNIGFYNAGVLLATATNTYTHYTEHGETTARWTKDPILPEVCGWAANCEPFSSSETQQQASCISFYQNEERSCFPESAAGFTTSDPLYKSCLKACIPDPGTCQDFNTCAATCKTDCQSRNQTTGQTQAE